MAICSLCAERPWSRSVAVFTQAAAVCLLMLVHPSYWLAAIVAACVAIGIGLSWMSRRLDHLSASSQTNDEEPFQSIVLLMREPRYLDPAILQRLATEAWATEVVIEEGDESQESDPFGISRMHPHRSRKEEQNLKGSPPTLFGDEAPYMCMYWPALLAIHNNASPYFDDIDEVMAEINDPRVAMAVEQHQAWLSVDLISWLDDTEPNFDAADRLIGQLLGELADEENCTAVIDLLHGAIYPFAPDTIKKLREANPRDALTKPYFAPVVSVTDEEMQEAETIAKQRWPEFVHAFENRTEEEHFNVKARFQQESAVEYIWLTVTAIEANVIYGELGNEPLHINRKLGDRVRVPLENLSDWVHLSSMGERLLGGFTLGEPRRRKDR